MSSIMILIYNISIFVLDFAIKLLQTCVTEYFPYVVITSRH